MSLPWLRDNWFPLLQSLGIVGSLLFTGLTLARDLRARRISDQLLLNDQHRKLWGEVQRQPELGRVLQPEFNPQVTPISLAEEQFLRLVFVHFQNGWLIIAQGSLTSMEALKLDTSDFFRLPGPCHLWDRVKHTHDPMFVRFVGECTLGSDAKVPQRTT